MQFIYSYANKGNTLAKVSSNGDRTTFSYNDLNKITKIAYPGGSTSSAYGYDGNGLRVKKIGIDGGVTYFIYDGPNVIMELDGNGNSTAQYTYGPQGLVSERRSGTSYYTGNDHLGTVWNMVTLDSSETVVSTYTYTAFGNTTANDTIGNPFRYVGALGYYQDFSDSGLMLLGARYYDSSLGRFMTVDPIKHGRNWYGYVDDRPSKMVDPKGLEPGNEDDCQSRQICCKQSAGLDASICAVKCGWSASAIRGLRDTIACGAAVATGQLWLVIVACGAVVLSEFLSTYICLSGCRDGGDGEKSSCDDAYNICMCKARGERIACCLGN